jgi:hypothetical protein
MTKSRKACMWTTAALLLAVGTAPAQERKEAKEASAAAVEERAGPRVRVRFLESRQRGDKRTTVPSCAVVLHAGEKGAFLFVGTQVALRTSDRSTPAVLFKNSGMQANVTVEALPDGRFRVDASFENGSLLAPEGGAPAASEGGNPVLRAIKGESRMVVRAGETVPFASAVDTVTGEVVRIDLVVEPVAASTPKASGAPAAPDARYFARFVLQRRKGGQVLASRPYFIALPAAEDRPASVFSGAMLPLEVTHQGQATIMLKDIGAGARLGARRIADGSYRLDLSLSDGTLAATSGPPRVNAFQVESRLYLREGESVVVASAVDPTSGVEIEAEVTLEPAR